MTGLFKLKNIAMSLVLRGSHFLPLLGLLSCSMSAEDVEVRHYKAMASVDLWNGYETAQFANGT